MTILYFALGAFLRRWFGGCLADYKILNSRGVQTAAMLAVFLSIYLHDFSSWLNWLAAIVVSCWLQFQFWSRGHGACFDIGRGTPTAETISRYNERWYHYPVDWLFDRLFKAEKYGFMYDFIYMFLRYTCPMIPMMLIDWHYILLGMAISPIYAFCWTLYEREPWIFKSRIPFVSSATNLAEEIAGGIVFAGCYWLQNGFWF